MCCECRNQDGVFKNSLTESSLSFLSYTQVQRRRKLKLVLTHLLEAMEAYRAENEQPKVSYETETVNLGVVSIGDDILILDDLLGYNVLVRLLEYDRYPFDNKVRPLLCSW